ncbi:N-acetyltransferase [Carbonactinospora thermoautotrophica]|uniref:GNAT family N-acetyltransferase n=1 Tax=Carbonactinospora thermoautotrophica TaxID=1469144 RepID=UPI00226FB409|nr:GNAT family N-acetyltransferase [Carbonactinospora thermoautotrophica]MCX9191609.1 N-acetyltransferase [Carbonactinospora thermoautotrophica]
MPTESARTVSRPTIRVGDRPGDLGAVAALHGVLYAREYGMDQTVEAYVAGGMADLVMARNRDGEAAGRLWVADDAGRVVGSIGVTRAGDSTAQLRWFLVDPAQRGQGLGRRLLRTALDYARERGFSSMFLWTNACLEVAHRLYREAGFTLTESRPVHQWGLDLIEQRFDLRLA